MKLFEIISGSGWVETSFALRGWEVAGLNIDPRTEANIREYKYGTIKPSLPDISMQFGPAPAAHNTRAPVGAQNPQKP